ncbi:MAG: hypothetical protein IJ121_01335 [Eubacterium sp.]|nr:hypothetical protein [Eubacterium sp.]
MKSNTRHHSLHHILPAAVLFIMMLALLLPGTTVSAAAKKIVPKQEISYNIENGNKSFAWQLKYQYDKKGRIKKETEKAGDETTVTTYKYNKKGNIKSWIRTVNGANDTKEVVTYKKNKKVLEQDYNWDPASRTWQKSDYYKYKISKKKSVMDCFNASGTLVYRSVDKYNKKGLIVSTTDTDYDEETGAVSQTVQHSCKYNKKGLLTSETYTYTYSDGTVSTSKTTYQYSKFYKGNKKYPRETKIYEDGVLTQQIVTSYKKI